MVEGGGGGMCLNLGDDVAICIFEDFRIFFGKQKDIKSLDTREITWIALLEIRLRPFFLLLFFPSIFFFVYLFICLFAVPN